MTLLCLRRAKREQLEEEGLSIITSTIVSRRISKYELALYCRRRTHGVETTVRTIEHLLQEMRGEKGRDLMGVPLLDTMKMEKIWHIQKRHVKCIQDVSEVSLYTETGTTTKGGIVLTRKQSKPTEFSAVSPGRTMQVEPGPGSSFLNQQALLSPHIFWGYGELIGVDYLLAQTGQPLQRVDPDADETDQLLEEVNVDDKEDEGFEEDLNEDPTGRPHNRYSQN
ncbi:hypothetical protein QTP70_008849 [Hemibagrus guttatus]|uniref:Uncharacterized protein n=1 Tax=Hemibagrus guttatus TaxID=175788 RepID=A0AAE0QZY3_9TELE|nr:hypothetical protein QTP70_008849 [Hemibagrus guttatus]KAK3562579.1 hypothetical protein QTP86_002057 [Hemibagrus guttatus]